MTQQMYVNYIQKMSLSILLALKLLQVVIFEIWISSYLVVSMKPDNIQTF